MIVRIEILYFLTEGLNLALLELSNFYMRPPSEQLLAEITSLQSNILLSKHEHLVQGVMNAIDGGVLARGSQLPSINVMAQELGYARKTIVKAYEDLKSRGIVESKQFKGYFIANENTNLVLKVAILLYAFQSFQETFYNTLRKHLKGDVQLDVFFHHNNPDVFTTIFSSIEKRYGMYVVAPIQSQKTAETLCQIPPEKLLIVDRYIDLGKHYSYIAQEFEQSTYQLLQQLLPRIQGYEEVILFYRAETDQPAGIQKGFRRFMEDQQVAYQQFASFQETNVRKGRFYFCIGDSDLLGVVRASKLAGLKIGQDIGISSCNESLLKEIIGDGITTLSSDFSEMGRLAADFVNFRKPVRTILSTQLNDRGSV